jgi:hypothetical protein
LPRVVVVAVDEDREVTLEPDVNLLVSVLIEESALLLSAQWVALTSDEDGPQRIRTDARMRVLNAHACNATTPDAQMTN